MEDAATSSAKRAFMDFRSLSELNGHGGRGESLPFRGQRDGSRPSAGADDDERHSIEEPDVARFERCMVDLVAVVDANDARIPAGDAESNERLRRRHDDSSPIPDGDGNEGQVVAIGSDAGPGWSERKWRRGACGPHPGGRPPRGPPAAHAPAVSRARPR